MGEGERGRWDRLSNVRLHLNQSSEPDSGSALGYFLNTKTEEETEKERETVCNSQPAVLPNSYNRWYKK